jgi:predicted nucleotidyltransferase
LRAKGCARPNSDIDLAIYGVQEEMKIEKIAMGSDALPLLYKIDVVSFRVENPALRDHIERVGSVIYTRPAQGRHSRKTQ